VSSLGHFLLPSRTGHILSAVTPVLRLSAGDGLTVTDPSPLKSSRKFASRNRLTVNTGTRQS
jgi:hypothetical protein